MIKQEITITADTSDVRVDRQTTRELQQWQAQTLQRLQVEPGKPKYPIRWTSERQRKAFFATDGFGRGIPTRRTHALSQGWRVFVDIEQVNRIEAFTADLLTFLTRIVGGTPPIARAPDVIIQVDNPVHYEQYVTGIHQQGFHQDTGWYYTPTVIESAFHEVEGILSD